MMKNILLPLDGSPLAELAIPYAATMARRAGATVVLVQAVQAHTPPGVDQTDAELAVMDRAQAYLRSVEARLTAEQVRVAAHVYYDEPAHALLDAAERQSVDLIVMSTHGRSGIGRMLYGSVADLVLRHATVPVFLVPAGTSGETWLKDRAASVLVPLDGSELAEDALKAAEMLPLGGDSTVHLLRVIEPPVYPIYGDGYTFVPFDEDAELADARQYLAEQTAKLRARGRHTDARVAVGQPAAVIAATARELRPDIVVMATHGHGGLSRLILGSVATSTLRQTTTPLLLTRPSAMLRDHLERSSRLERPGDSPAVSQAAPAAQVERAGEVVHLHVSRDDLELIECGLKALAYAPGYDYDRIQAARTLANRLETSVPADADRALRAEPLPVG
ncbi:MAG: universal stress protein [Chloroflexota bacterium]